MWRRAWGGKFGLRVNTDYKKIAKQILTQPKFANIKGTVTKNNLNKYINSPEFKKTWERGRGSKNVYRSKEIIKALYGLPLNANENIFYNVQQQFNNRPEIQATKFSPTYGVF